MIRQVLALAALALAARAAAASALPTGKVGETVTVRREGVRLMKAARFYGAGCGATVPSGQKVKVVERRKAWARIASPGGGACWLHESAWSDRSAGELASAAPSGSQRDVELAGRGFSEEEERRYRGEKPDLASAFEVIDAHVEAGAEPDPAEMDTFAAEGGLGGGR
jgi:SH3-like domain-containing protein